MATMKITDGDKKKDKGKPETTKSAKPPKNRARKALTAKEIIDAAWRVDFTKDEEIREFEFNYKKDWMKRPGNGLLHELAANNSLSERKTKVPQFLDWLLERHYDLLEKLDKVKYTPLHIALREKNVIFVNAVLNNRGLRNIDKILLQTCQDGNSLHLAIMHRLDVGLLGRLIESCSKPSELLDSRQGVDMNTPLHACMARDIQADEEFEDEEDEDGEEELGVDSEDGQDDGTEISQEQAKKLTGDNFGGSPADSTSIKTTTSQGLKVSSLSQDFLVDNSKRQKLLAQPRSMDTAIDGDDQQLKIVELLVKKHDMVLRTKNSEERTPYQERIHLLRKKFDKNPIEQDQARSEDKSPPSRDEDFRKRVTKDRVADWIRSYCVRTFSRDKIMACLYQPGQERHIEFDLAGINSSIPSDYLERLENHLRFESILKYVALPKLTIEKSPAMVRNKRKSEQVLPKRGLSQLIKVFDWLHDNNVEKIVKVIVVDDGELSHADASIEKALKRFQVEIWDWKKLDLSTEVICNSTKMVREISLYSSGNNAVLMGWASPQGLPNKTKFPELKEITLYIRQGLEDRQRRDLYIQAFKEAIKSETKDRIKVKHILDTKDASYASGFQSGEGSLLQDNPWIECAAKFASLLRTSPQKNSTRPIKIAVIDDGVDASLESLDGKIASGKSFCPYPHSSDLMSSYFVPGGNHGTYMAMLICKICPEVRLYIARLDERTSAGNSHRQVTAKSAANAIRWATDCGVDIISMSWTIENPIIGNEDMDDLRNAAKGAIDKKILLFGSTSDQGNATKDNCFPAGFDGCIKIGSATHTGEALAWVNEHKIDFLFPGKDVAFVNNEGKSTVESGSSVATAAAAGLAGLLIFWSWLLDGKDMSMKDSRVMRDAFKSMAAGEQPYNFPRVQDLLDRKFKQQLGKAQGRSQNAKNSMDINLSTLSWDDNCQAALQHIMDETLKTSH